MHMNVTAMAKYIDHLYEVVVSWGVCLKLRVSHCIADAYNKASYQPPKVSLSAHRITTKSLRESCWLLKTIYNIGCQIAEN